MINIFSTRRIVAVFAIVACLLLQIHVLKPIGGISASGFLDSIERKIGDANATSRRANATSSRMAHVVLVENRDLEGAKPYGYYTFAMWKFYANINPRVNLLAYNSSSLCDHGNCAGYNGIHMSPYWMKVLAVLHAMDEANAGDLIVFMDTDMQILNANFMRSIFDLHEIQSFLRSGKSMLVIDERIRSHWYRENHRKGLYKAPIVSNLFAVINDQVGRRMMEIWWESMAHPTKWDPSGTGMLWGWPWEQERLAAYYDAEPDLFFPLNQSWSYLEVVPNCTMGRWGMRERCRWIHHGPLCCGNFANKHDIISSLNGTLMNQTRALSLHNGSYEELAHDLFRQIQFRTLTRKEIIGHSSHDMKGFWNTSKA